MSKSNGAEIHEKINVAARIEWNTEYRCDSRAVKDAGF